MTTKITPEKFEEIREKIGELEYAQNHMYRLNGTNVIVRNLRIRGQKVIADIILEFENRTEPFNELEYDLEKLGVEI